MGGILWSLLAIVLIKTAPESGHPSVYEAWIRLGVAVLFVFVVGRCMARTHSRAGRSEALLTLGPHLALALLLHGFDIQSAVAVIPPLSWPFLSTSFLLAPYIILRILALKRSLSLRDYDEDQARGLARLRLQFELLPFLPFIMIQGTADLLSRFDVIRIPMEQITLLQVAGGLLAIALVLCGLPMLLPKMWSLKQLPDSSLRRELESMAGRVGFRCRGIYLWPTDSLMANAAIIGLGSRFRIVVLTDLLLQQMDSRQLLSVFGHEIGHARLKHVRTFFCFGMILVVLMGLALTRLEDPILMRVLTRSCSQVEADLWPIDLLSIVLLVCFGLVFWILFGRLSRAAEREADLFAVEATGGDSDAFSSALLSVGGYRTRDLTRRSWRHDSPADRVKFLHDLERSPARLVGFKKRMNRVRVGFALGALVCFGFVGTQLIVGLPVELYLAEVGPGQLRSSGVSGHDASIADRPGRWCPHCSCRVHCGREFRRAPGSDRGTGEASTA